METVKCKGCGAILQMEDPLGEGYVVRSGMEYCQRCFRMIHYDSHKETRIEPMTDLKMLEQLKGCFFWIVDVIDLATSFNSDFVPFFQKRDFVLIVNKCDLLPEGVSEDKIRDYITGQLKQKHLRCLEMLFRGFDDGFRERFALTAHQHQDEDLIMAGIANVGKSTVINDLLEEKKLTVNRHPSTTLSLNYLPSQYGTIVDTVGLVADGSAQSYLTTGGLKKILPIARIRPRIYQLSGDQTLALGGIARIDLVGCRQVSLVAYISNLCPLERGKLENGDRLWQEHFGELFAPVTARKLSQFRITSFKGGCGKRDVCISGVGWLCISGHLEAIRIHCDRRITISERKAMI
ncbi:MAG: 50S ribosome-binding GTPase [Erysipelotrichaceae bacterium]|nr:50S ribosome-binding GTPase [Erysipelotrichaceae bacterium]